MTFIRERKDGGFSECSSPDELVGKGRCCHILSHNHDTIEIKRIQRGMYEVDISDSKVSINAQKDAIIKFFNNMSNIGEEKTKEIIEFLKEE